MSPNWRLGAMLRQTTLFMVEKISAVTLRVANMEASVHFYKDVLGLEIVYGGERSYFTSFRTKDGDTILNLEHGNAGIQWGRLIFQVSDVDRFWALGRGKADSTKTTNISATVRLFDLLQQDRKDLNKGRSYVTKH